MYDLSIIVLCPEKDFPNYLKDFSLTDMKSNAACTKKHSDVVLGVILTNKLKCFHHTTAFTTCDCHKLILSCLTTHFKRLPPKKIFYRD